MAIADETAGKAVTVAGKVLVRNSEAKEGPGVKFLQPGDSVSKGTVINTSSASSVKLLMTDRTILDLGGSTLFKVNDYKLRNGDDRTVDLSMEYGKLRASVNTPVKRGKFQVRTNSATMGVRGTEFIVGVTLDTSEKNDDKGDPGNATGAPGEGGGSKGRGADGNDDRKGGQTTTVTVVEGKVEVKTETTPTGDVGSGGGEEKTYELTEGTQLTTSTSTDTGIGDSDRDPASTTEPQVTQLSTEQLNEVRDETKQDDSTVFTQAVVVEGSSNTGGGGGGGEETLAALGEAITSETQNIAPPKIDDLPIPGSVTPETFVNNEQTLGQLVKLKVLFVK